MSPSLTAGLPGGSRAGFTSGGIVLHVRGLKNYTSGLQKASSATMLFGRSMRQTGLGKTAKDLLGVQNALIKASNAIIKIGVIGAAAGAAIAVGVGAAAIKTASDVQQLTYALQGLVAIELGKEQVAQGLVLDMSTAMEDAIPIATDLRDKLRDLSLESPIQYEQVFNALRLQLAYGATARATGEFTAKVKEFGLSMDKAESPALALAEATSQVGAVLARDSATFERLNYNLAQAILKGDLTAKNMRELKNAGLSLEDVFESELNMTLEETRQALKDGTIATEDLQVAFISFADKYFAPAAENMTRSLKGLLNNFKDLWAFAATDLATPVLEVVTKELGLMFDEGEKLLKQGVFKKMGEDIADFATKTINAVKSIDAFDIAVGKSIAQTAIFTVSLVAVGGQLIKVINTLSAASIAAKKFLILLELRTATMGFSAALSSLVNVTAIWTAGIGLAVVAIAALVIAVNNWYDAQKQVSEELIFETDTYDEYLEKLEQEKASRWAVTESLYDELKARKELDEFFTTDDLQDQAIALGDLVYAMESNYESARQVGKWWLDLTGTSRDFSEEVKKLYDSLTDQQKILGANSDELQRILVMVGFNEDAARSLAPTIAVLFQEWNAAEDAEEKTKALEKAMSELDTRVNRAIPGYLAQQLAQDRLTKSTEDTTKAEVDQKQVLEDLESALDEITERYEQWNDALVDTLGTLQEIEQDMVDAHQDFADEIADINADLSKDLKEIGEEYDDAMPDPTSEEERAGMIVDAWDEWARRMKAIRIEDPGQDLDAEGGWLATIIAWTDGTDAAMRENEENVQGWMLRLERLFYEGKLPDEFYEEAKQTRAWQEFFADLKLQRDADEQDQIDKANAKREREEAELEAAKANAEQERQDALLLGALTLAESTGQLGRWADTLGPVLGSAYQTADQVFGAIKKGALSIPPELAAIIVPLMAGLQNVSDSAEGIAEKNETALDNMAAKAQDVTPTVEELKNEYDALKGLVDTFGGPEKSPFGEEFSPEEIQAMKDRMVDLEDQLKTFGVSFGEDFPGQADEMQTTIESLFAGITTGIAALDAENQALADGLADTAGGVAEAWYNAYFGESVVPDTQKAVKDVQTAWDLLMLHMKVSLKVTTNKIKQDWLMAVKNLKTYLTNLKTKLDDVANSLKEIKEMSPIKVVIEIKVQSSPEVGLEEGAAKVDNLAASLDAIPEDVGVVVHIDLPRAEQFGANFGAAIVAFQSAQSGGGKGTHGRWWDFTKNLQVPAKRIAGIAEAFAKIYEDRELIQWQDRISEIDKILKQQTLEEAERNKLMEERLHLQDLMIQNEETMTRLEKARADLDFLNQQVELLEMIRNHGLNARQILGDITLGVDASASELMTVTTRALEAIVEQINNQLKIASPSKVMMDIGRYMMMGMGAGIEAAAAIPVEATTMQAVAPIVAQTGAMGPMNITMNNTINNGIDQAVFENRVLDIIRRGARGY